MSGVNVAGARCAVLFAVIILFYMAAVQAYADNPFVGTWFHGDDEAVY
jgi:hypothetical protein